MARVYNTWHQAGRQAVFARGGERSRLLFERGECSARSQMAEAYSNRLARIVSGYNMNMRGI